MLLLFQAVLQTSCMLLLFGVMFIFLYDTMICVYLSKDVFRNTNCVQVWQQNICKNTNDKRLMRTSSSI